MRVWPQPARPTADFGRAARTVGSNLALTGLGLAVGALLALGVVGFNADVALAVCGMVAQAAIIILNPLLGFLVWVASAPYVPYTGLSLDLSNLAGPKLPNPSTTRVGLFVLMIIFVLGAATGRRKLAQVNRIDLLMLLFGAALLFSARASFIGAVHGIQAVYDSYLLPFAVYFIARNLTRNQQTLRRVIDAALFIGLYLAALAIHELLTGQPLFYDQASTTSYSASLLRVISLLGDPAYIAYILAMVMPLSIIRGLEARKPGPRLAYGAFALTCFVTIFFLYNRTGWGVEILSVAILLPFYPRLRRLLLPVLVALLVLGGLFWGAISQSAIVTERLQAQKPIDYRVNTLNAGLQLISESPIFGIGYENFPWVALQRGYVPSTVNFYIPTTHNAFIDVGVSAGLVGLSTFVGLIVAISYTILEKLRRTRARPELSWAMPLLAALFSAEAAYFLPGFTLDLAPAWFVSMVFFMLLGAIVGAVESAEGAA